MAAAASLMLSCAPTRAAWLEASTDHFVIEADASDARLRDFATRLERFDAALHTLYHVADDPARGSNRVRIFATNADAIQKLSGNRGVAGYYLARPGRSVIFTTVLVPAAKPTAEIGSLIATVKGYDLDAQSVLLHEYSHHFMFSNFPKAYPMWFTEGFAEFNGSAQFRPDGTVVIGAAPQYRGPGLYHGFNLSITDLLDPPKRVLTNGEAIDVLYGRGWLLTHYLMLEGGHPDQLGRYLDELNAGKPSIEAARSAFGDLAALDKTITSLRDAHRLNAVAVAGTATAPNVTILPLSAGAAATMHVRMQSTSGVAREQAGAVASEAERAALPYPADPTAQRVLAEAEFDAGHDELSDAAADRVLKADPVDVDALLFKGRIASRRLVKAQSHDAVQWRAARGWFVRANNHAPDTAEPLLLYYRSFLDAGERPPEIAYQGLRRAQQLSPEAGEIRLLIAGHMIADGDVDGARAMLKPVAYAPHGQNDESGARAALDALDAGKRADAQAALAVAAPASGS